MKCLEMRGTSRVCQCESNGCSCNVDSDVFQCLIQCDGEGLLRSRISCSLKNCHLTELRERGKNMSDLLSDLYSLNNSPVI